MKVLSVQPTPNPNAFKFVLDGQLLQSGVKNYANPDEAKADPLATAVFAIEGVDTVFLCENFVTVSMLADADWRTVHDAVVQVIEAHEGPATPIAGDQGLSAAPVGSTAQPSGDAALLSQINDLLDDRVRPALAGDGGGLEVMALEGKTLHIRYQGACGSCPSSIAGTLHAIQSLVQTEIDEELEVISV